MRGSEPAAGVVDIGELDRGKAARKVLIDVGGVTQTIVRCAFGRIRENFVGFLHDGELLARVRMIVDVGVILLRTLSKRGGYLLAGGVDGKREHLVEVDGHLEPINETRGFEAVGRTDESREIGIDLPIR